MVGFGAQNLFDSIIIGLRTEVLRWWWKIFEGVKITRGGGILLSEKCNALKMRLILRNKEKYGSMEERILILVEEIALLDERKGREEGRIKKWWKVEKLSLGIIEDFYRHKTR